MSMFDRPGERGGFPGKNGALELRDWSFVPCLPSRQERVLVSAVIASYAGALAWFVLSVAWSSRSLESSGLHVLVGYAW